MIRKLTMAIAITGLVAGISYAGTAPKSGINGSKHDMNILAGATADTLARTCVFCHTPHNATASGSSAAPLWNRNDTAVIANSAYQWQAPANKGILIGSDPTTGPTRLCLSCHDGTLAADSHNSNGAAAGTKKLNGTSAEISTLTTHPIGFAYSAAVAARPGELVPQTTPFLDSVPAGFDTHNRGAAGSGKTIESTLFNGEFMTCATCHEVHNRTNASPDPGHTYNYFLNAKEEGSAICLSCHIK